MRITKAGIFASAVIFFCVANIATAQKKESKNHLPYVPADINHLTVVRPAAIVKSNDYAEFKSAIGKDFDKVFNRFVNQYFKFGLAKFKEIDSIVNADWFYEADIDKRKYKRLYRVMIINTLVNHSDQFDMATHAVKEEIEFENKTILQLKKPMDRFRYACILNDKSIVWSEHKEAIETVIKAGEKASLKSDWYAHWQPLENKSFSMVQKFERGTFDYVADADLKKLSNAELVVSGFDVGKTFKATIAAVCPDKTKATEFIGGAKRVVGKYSSQVREQFSHNPLVKHWDRQLDEFVSSIHYEQQRNVVKVSASMRLKFESLAEPLNQIYEAEGRTYAANMIRQNALAFHNFESAMGHFPKSVYTHESGKKYSWRIAILPYIGRNDIYEKYDFTQDWDSPHNLEVTSEMPDVFRSDMDDTDSTNASFFLLTGPGGMFGGDDPIRFQDMTDGSSNTILAVEAKRDIHWAKPEDIEIHPDQPLPDFGGFHKGGFNVARADGSVSFFAENVVERYLRDSFTPNGGEIIGDIELEPTLEDDDPFRK